MLYTIPSKEEKRPITKKEYSEADMARFAEKAAAYRIKHFSETETYDWDDSRGGGTRTSLYYEEITASRYLIAKGELVGVVLVFSADHSTDSSGIKTADGIGFPLLFGEKRVLTLKEEDFGVRYDHTYTDEYRICSAAEAKN